MKESRPSEAWREDRGSEEEWTLVRSIAENLQQSLPVPVAMDFLVSIGLLGLANAAASYRLSDTKTEGPVEFATYAKTSVRGFILDNLRHPGWASLDLVNLARNLRPAESSGADGEARYREWRQSISAK